MMTHDRTPMAAIANVLSEPDKVLVAMRLASSVFGSGASRGGVWLSSVMWYKGSSSVVVELSSGAGAISPASGMPSGSVGSTLSSWAATADMKTPLMSIVVSRDRMIRFLFFISDSFRICCFSLASGFI